jgi:pSer/pThr/pTyr-binding forkhead associated (FHA) protein
MESRPTVGILHRKKISTEKVGSSFSSLSLLPDEFNRSLSDVDTINTLKGDAYGLDNLSNSDIEMGHAEKTQQKIFLQTTGPRGRKVKSSENNVVLVYNTTFGGKMVFPLEKVETSIGRKDNNDIVLSDSKISKKHAIIIKNGDM